MRAVERHAETVIKLISSLGLLKIGFMLVECAGVFDSPTVLGFFSDLCD